MAIPSPPSALVATASSASQINLSWAYTGTGEDGFKIERSQTPGEGFAEVAQVASGVFSYADSGLAEVTTYYYRVVAFNSEGDSSPSNEASATTPIAAPTGLSAVAVGPERIDLSWNELSSVETGYAIERSVENGPWMEIARVGPDVTSYSDTKVWPRLTYRYRVRAFRD